jgi:hypothetical protein
MFTYKNRPLDVLGAQAFLSSTWHPCHCCMLSLKYGILIMRTEKKILLSRGLGLFLSMNVIKEFFCFSVITYSLCEEQCQ